MTSGERRPARRVFYWIVPALSVLGTLVLAEAFVRFLWPQPFSIETNAYYVADPRLGYRMKPDSVGSYFGHIPLRVNANGHRDAWVPHARSPGSLRLLVLGDSQTVGAGVAEEESWPQVLEDLLRPVYPGVEVVNAAVGGWQPVQYAEYLAREGFAFRPDLVLVGFFVGNDTYDAARSGDDIPMTAMLGRRVRRASANHPLAKPRILLYEQSHLARAVLGPRRGAALERDRAYEASVCEALTPSFLAVQRQRLPNHRRRAVNAMQPVLDHMERIARESLAHGEPARVVLLPDATQVSRRLRARIVPPGRWREFDWSMPQRELVPELEARGLRVLDLLPRFARDGECRFNNHTHIEPDGHRWVAESVAEWLRPDLDRIVEARRIPPAR